VPSVVLADQSLETNQDIECLAQRRCALGGDPRQAEVAGLTVQAHQQAEIGPAAESDGGMPQAHEPGNADPHASLSQLRWADAVALQQWFGIMPETAQGSLQAVQISDREITKFHGCVILQGRAECNPGL